MNYPDYVIGLLQKAADKNDAEALFQLGVCYEANYPDKAEEFLHRACELNHAEAQRQLGKLLLKKGNQDEGVNLLAQIATNGDASAQSILAEYYFDERKYEQALVWLKVTARNKDIRAYYLLSLCYGYGYGVKRDTRKAKAMWESLSKDTPYGNSQLARLYREGEDRIKKDNKKAAEYLAKSIASGEYVNLLDLALIYQCGGYGLPRSFKNAYLCYYLFDLLVPHNSSTYKLFVCTIESELPKLAKILSDCHEGRSIDDLRNQWLPEPVLQLIKSIPSKS